MSWPELDLDAGLWTLPAARAKNRREHLVPLSPPVISILRARAAEQEQMGMDTALVFTSSGTAPFSGWSRSKDRLDHRTALPAWTLHDLRRALVTRMNEDLHIAPHVVEAIVNHAGGIRSGVAGVYNRALYLDERRAALDSWARYLLRAVDERPAGNVVEFVR